jgi:hypothetical protein
MSRLPRQVAKSWSESGQFDTDRGNSITIVRNQREPSLYGLEMIDEVLKCHIAGAKRHDET